MKIYAFNGLAGCVVQRRNRLTGTMVGVYNAEQAGLETFSGSWVCICELHNTTCNFATLAEARYHAPSPDWCEVCMRTLDKKG